MQVRSIKKLIVLGVITLIGMLAVQAVWLKSSLDSRQSQFSQNVQSALRASATTIIESNGGDASSLQPVEQLSSNYFVIPINDVIQPMVLKSILLSEFQLRGIDESFEFSIYDCSNEKLIFGNYVHKDEPIDGRADYPEIAKEDYYFSVLFPNISFQLISEMSLWVSSSLILLVIVVIYSFTLMMLLKQKLLADIQKDFINNMTHEFKTPLASISASSEMILKHDLTPQRQEQYAQIIHKEAQRLTGQVEKFLDVSKLEEASLSINLSQFDLVELVEEALEHFNKEITAGANRLKVNNQLNDSIICSDRLYLSNCFFNLIDNAIKYGGKPLAVEVIIYQDQHNYFCIEVVDNGIGIPSKAQEDVFKRFYRVSTGDVHNVKGFGLGLHYAKSISEALGGDIILKSSSSRGSTFVLKCYNHAA